MRSAFIRRMSVLLLALFWAAAPTVRCQQESQPTGEVLTLDEAINVALRDNRSIKNARLGVEKSDEQLSATRTARLPVIKFHSIVSEDLVKHDVNLSNPVSTLIPGLGPFSWARLEGRPQSLPCKRSSPFRSSTRSGSP